MAENIVEPATNSEPERQQGFFETQESLLKTWAGETRDPKTGALTERRIVANGRPYMVTYGKDGKSTGYGYV